MTLRLIALPRPDHDVRVMAEIVGGTWAVHQSVDGKDIACPTDRPWRVSDLRCGGVIPDFKDLPVESCTFERCFLFAKTLAGLVHAPTMRRSVNALIPADRAESDQFSKVCRELFAEQFPEWERCEEFLTDR